MWRHQKWQKNGVFLIFWENRVVALWRYVATSKIAKMCFFCDILFGKIGLWRCGDMWRHQTLQKTVFFLFFWKNRVVALWRYVAICGDIKHCKKRCFSDFFGKSGCGDMWRHKKWQKRCFSDILGKSGCGAVAICGDIKNCKNMCFL